MGNQCCVDKKADMMAEYDSIRSGSKRKNIKKEKELASGEEMGDDKSDKKNQSFGDMDEDGVTTFDRDKIDTIVSV